MALMLAQLPSLVRYERAFANDDTQALIQWLRTELPPTAVLDKDNRIALPDPARKKDATRLGAQREGGGCVGHWVILCCSALLSS